MDKTLLSHYLFRFWRSGRPAFAFSWQRDKKFSTFLPNFTSISLFIGKMFSHPSKYRFFLQHSVFFLENTSWINSCFQTLSRFFRGLLTSFWQIWRHFGGDFTSRSIDKCFQTTNQLEPLYSLLLKKLWFLLKLNWFVRNPQIDWNIIKKTENENT